MADNPFRRRLNKLRAIQEGRDERRQVAAMARGGPRMKARKPRKRCKGKRLPKSVRPVTDPLAPLVKIPKRPAAAESKMKKHIRHMFDVGVTVDDDGNVYGMGGSLIKPWDANIHGRVYPYASITISAPVHRLVAFAKYGEASLVDDIVVRHRDDVSTNNRKENILIGTHVDNASDRMTGNRKASLREFMLPDSRRRSSQETIDSIRSDYVSTDMFVYEISKKHDVSTRVIGQLCQGLERCSEWKTRRRAQRREGMRKRREATAKTSPDPLPNLRQVEMFDPPGTNHEE